LADAAGQRSAAGGGRSPGLNLIVAGDETKFEKSEREMKFVAIFLIAPAVLVLV
jgi:hypothetical protein